jgi:hypothetical protein
MSARWRDRVASYGMYEDGGQRLFQCVFEGLIAG